MKNAVKLFLRDMRHGGQIVLLIAITLAFLPAGFGLATLSLTLGPSPELADQALNKIASVFGAGEYAPHIYCLAFHPGLVGATIAGDGMTFLAYLLIPVGLIMIALDLLAGRYDWGDVMPQFAKWWLLFAIFVLMCGAGHLIKIINLYAAQYWLEAYWTIGTGLVSLMTAAVVAAARAATVSATNENRRIGASSSRAAVVGNSPGIGDIRASLDVAHSLQQRAARLQDSDVSNRAASELDGGEQLKAQLNTPADIRRARRMESAGSRAGARSARAEDRSSSTENGIDAKLSALRKQLKLEG